MAKYAHGIDEVAAVLRHAAEHTRHLEQWWRDAPDITSGVARVRRWVKASQKILALAERLLDRAEADGKAGTHG